MKKTCKVLAIQGSYRNTGKKTSMLKYAAELVENQSVEVDAVSGATNSSRVIRNY